MGELEPKYTVVVPLYNESENIRALHNNLTKVMDGLDGRYEIIYVNDGSEDDSLEILKDIVVSEKSLKVLDLTKNFGQTPALAAGFNNSSGDIVITLDADLQNDPRDIPRLISKIEEGYDVVSGWRYERKDNFSKKLFSKISNGLAGKLTGLRLHDYGCTLKAYKKEALEGIELYSEFHRYIPALIHSEGYKVTEMKVKHHPREKGETKYGSKRFLRGFLDLVNLAFWNVFSTRPMHFFGGIGILSFVIGLGINIYLLLLKILFNEDLSNRPLLLLGILLITLGIQLFMLGFIGAMITRTYYGGKRTIYNIREIIE